MEATRPAAVRVLLPTLLILVGLGMVVIGALRPEWLWSIGKIETGRAVLGESGTAIFLTGLGVLLVAGGVFSGIKLRR